MKCEQLIDNIMRYKWVTRKMNTKVHLKIGENLNKCMEEETKRSMIAYNIPNTVAQLLASSSSIETIELETYLRLILKEGNNE